MLVLDFAHSFFGHVILCPSLEVQESLMIFNFSHTGIGRPETHTRGAGVELLELDYEKRVDNQVIVP